MATPRLQLWKRRSRSTSGTNLCAQTGRLRVSPRAQRDEQIFVCQSFEDGQCQELPERCACRGVAGVCVYVCVCFECPRAVSVKAILQTLHKVSYCGGLGMNVDSSRQSKDPHLSYEKPVLASCLLFPARGGGDGVRRRKWVGGG